MPICDDPNESPLLKERKKSCFTGETSFVRFLTVLSVFFFFFVSFLWVIESIVAIFPIVAIVGNVYACVDIYK